MNETMYADDPHWGEVTRLPSPVEATEPILALGAELKSAPCLLEGDQAVLSKPLGHLAQPDTFRAFLRVIERFEAACSRRPELYACDMHPDYAATRYARKLHGRVTAVQHHHAHVVAAMAEHDRSGRVVGLVADGTGYGEDGTIWGCEVLSADAAGFDRLGHLRTFALLGGDKAAIETWRPAAGLLAETFGEGWLSRSPAMQRVDPELRKMAKLHLAADDPQWTRTSSLGRLFDAVAFLLGLCDRNETEAAAPIAVQQAAESADEAEELPWRIEDGPNGQKIQDFAPMIERLSEADGADESRIARLARGFHEAVAAMLAEAAGRVLPGAETSDVVLTGGCFVNSLLREETAKRLREAGAKVYIQDKLPPGDDCVAYGQAVAAAERLRRGELSPRKPSAFE
jgi:hydrogenase maturation protein HypF